MKLVKYLIDYFTKELRRCRNGRNFEKQIEKVIDYIDKLGYHGHKNYAERLFDGTYLRGEPFDYEIFYKDYHAVFDAKEVQGDTWHIVKKDIVQANNLKKCKNAGLKAYFLICFDKKDVRQLDVDIVIENLKENRKSIKKDGLPNWDLISRLKNV